MDRCKKNIFHLFYGDLFYHAQRMIVDIAVSPHDFCHHFVVFLTAEKLVQDYQNFFKKYHIPDYTILYLGNQPWHIMKGKNRRESLLNIQHQWQVIILIKGIWKFRRMPILVHGFFPILIRFLSPLIFKNVSFICWGGTWGSGLGQRLRYMTFQGLRKVVFLQESDMRRYQSVIKGKNTQCLCLNYVDYLHLDLPPQQDHIILLGNSGACWKEYIYALNWLKGKTIPEGWTVCCMVAYALDLGSREYKELKDIAHNMPFKVEFWEQIIPLKEYMQKLNSADIIIIGVEIQAALGAIFTGFRFGKKIFLTGTNLKTFKDAGAVCFDFYNIQTMSNEEFFKPLSEVEKKNNFQICSKFTLSKDMSESWKHFYESISE